MRAPTSNQPDMVWAIQTVIFADPCANQGVYRNMLSVCRKVAVSTPRCSAQRLTIAISSTNAGNGYNIETAVLLPVSIVPSYSPNYDIDASRPATKATAKANQHSPE